MFTAKKPSPQKNIEKAIIAAIFIIQFILLIFIYRQNSYIKKIFEQNELRLSTVEGHLRQMSAKINSIQSSVMRLNSQIYNRE
ncbi:hypothetical protein A2Y83_02805 [Candidatus Falkowbacteria bacterium RBG_13_39_14]|uniref:Uncharacterized protein n=1 Tax=Candidatus Falkowbacteria bacterium RBG_13_39_14 TaxID=1797985 RepID=A0A1F5S3J1_9BACT|nr:MAG: hypothetical protein A2Y83_02805 [Candidatus Falkowbacteria bacterium RBG_13_39_14]